MTTYSFPRYWPTILTLCGFVLLWALMDRSAAFLGSMRGENGLIVCALVCVFAILCECLLSRSSPSEAAIRLGFRKSERKARFWTLILSFALLLYFPLFATATGTSITLLPGALLLALGMFLQGGIAEEALFRGFLFRRMRERRTFWRGAGLAAIPFTAVHLLLFLTLDFPIALTSLLLALSISFPLAWLFECSGGSIYPPSILHGVTQAAIKLVDAGEQFALLALGWIALCATVPWLLFLILRPKEYG